MTIRTRLLLIGWLLQPAYIASELLIARRAGDEYSLRDATISELGVTFDSMNWSFIGFGALLAAGAIAMWRVLPRSRLSTTVLVLWLINAVGSIGVGLTPLDQAQTLHYIVALPIFVARPLALIGSALLLARQFPRTSRLTWVAAVLTTIGSVGFALRLDATWAGALERLALWPADIWFALAAATLLRPAARGVDSHRSRPGTPRA